MNHETFMADDARPPTAPDATADVALPGGMSSVAMEQNVGEVEAAAYVSAACTDCGTSWMVPTMNTDGSMPVACPSCCPELYDDSDTSSVAIDVTWTDDTTICGDADGDGEVWC